MKVVAFLPSWLLLFATYFDGATSTGIASLKLVDVATGADIRPLNNGDVLVKSSLPSTSCTIVAISTGTVKSVRFNLDNSTYRLENQVPWTLAGDSNGVYFPWSPVPLGNHRLIVTPYTEKKATGIVGAVMQVDFTVVATPPAPSPTKPPTKSPTSPPTKAPSPKPNSKPTSSPINSPTPIPTITSLRIEVNALNVPASQHSISPYLVGLHQVYTFTPDSVFQDGGAFVKWVKESGVSTSRFPGGTAIKYWDWENPTGQPFIDAKDPAFNVTLNPNPSTWTSLDEYLAFVNKTGIMPCLGVNSAHGATYNVEAEYIAKAVRMVKYVKERGFGGSHWYIGNEESHFHGGIKGYAQTFSRYARAMKAEDPDILVFFNDNDPYENSLTLFLANDNGTADGLETHGKWPYEGDAVGGLTVASFNEWMNEVPLRDRRNGNKTAGGRTYRSAANQYRAWAAKVGRPGLLISNNEYGFGKDIHFTGFNRFTKGLLVTEMLMENFIGNWHSSCFWDLTRWTDNGLLDRPNGYRLNPAHLGMDLLANSQGGTYLHTISTDFPNVHGFAASKDGKILVYLLNKSGQNQSIRLSLYNESIQSSSALLMINTSDGCGELRALPIEVTVGSDTTARSVLLPNLSFVQITLSPA